MSPVLFFTIAIAILASAMGVVVNRHPIRSALCLAVTLLLLAVMFVFLDAHLVAALQVIVYAGAILVLFLFVIMLLNLEEDLPVRRQRPLVWTSLVAGVAFCAAVVRSLAGSAASLPGEGMDAAVSAEFGTSAALGERLFTRFVLPFEVTSVLLLVAVLGAVVLSKKKID